MSCENLRVETKNCKIDKNKTRSKADVTAIANSEENTMSCIKGESVEEDVVKPSELCLQSGSHLVSSVTSSLADTPGDSGVLCLDSESSEMTMGSQALMSHSLVEAEELACDAVSQMDTQELSKSTSSIMTRSDIDNQNICTTDINVPELLVEMNKKTSLYDNLPDVVLKAFETEKSATKSTSSRTKDDKSMPRNSEPKKSLSEDIVYRRRCRKKSQNTQGSQKKRVSFHEDILNNTKTDNIHIEHGFVSYGAESSFCDRFKHKTVVADRSSWCASGDNTPKYAADVIQQTMSDILSYGDTKTEKSGIFEYFPDTSTNKSSIKKSSQLKSSRKNSYDDDISDKKSSLYGCESNSSDSNFSCDSESSSTDSSSSNSNKVSVPHRSCDKAQKSYSCDGFESNNHISFMRKMYFSEADIDQSHEYAKKPLELASAVSGSPEVKSVLKKKRYIPTNIVEERTEQNSRMLNILDTNHIFDSLKSFYKHLNFNLAPEKGVPEGTEDSNTVIEAMPCEVVLKKQLLSKSLDSGFHVEDEDDFFEISLLRPGEAVDEHIEVASVDSGKDSNDLLSTSGKNESPRHKLTLNMKSQSEKTTTDWKGNKLSETFPERNKCVVNYESTVYEHKGVSYSYVHDTFQTAFNAQKESFVPIPEGTAPTDLPPVAGTSKNTNIVPDEDLSTGTPERSSTPKRQYNKAIQEETEAKSIVSKHLSSPKKQNVSRYSKKYCSIAQKTSDDVGIKTNEEIGTLASDTCSTADNSTLRGEEDGEDVLDSPGMTRSTSHSSTLLNRYLKNVCQKKDLELKIKNNKFYQRKLKLEKNFPSIIYPWTEVSENFSASSAKMYRLIDKEVIENKRLSVRLLTADEPSYFDSFEDNVAIECSEKLRLQIFSYPSETLNRMLKVRSPYKMEDGSWTPLLVFITDYALYVAEVRPGRSEYNLLCRLPHDELDAIAMGPESQYVQVLDRSGHVACSLVTGESSLGARLASSLEWSARTSPLRPARPPAVLPLSCNVRARPSHEKQKPRVLFYGRACSGDSGEHVVEAPGAFAPPMEGYLMCRTDSRRRFEPCYFLLRAGVLHWGPHQPLDSNSSLPNNIALRAVLGVRRHVDNSRRPHCFEIAMSDSTRLLLAAPDDPTASSWLQSLLLHTAQCLEESGTKKVAPVVGPPHACTVLVTPHEVLSLRETLEPAFVVGAAAYLRDRGYDALLKEYVKEMRSDVEILACGTIKNLTAFKIPDNDENWCCLEWSVCEARERGAALAMVFASSAELERFISAVETAFCALTSEAFPLSVVDGDNSACSLAHSQYETAWAHMLPTQH